MATLEWNVKNAVNRDVERQHLNKILADIGNDMKKALASTGNSSQLNVKDVVGQMVSGNTETGITVTYDASKKVLNFQVPNFRISLTGDATGSGVVNALGDVTIPVVLSSQQQGVGEAPIDDEPYWRRNGMWDQVPAALRSLAELNPTDADILEWDAALNVWVAKKDPRELYLDGGNF